MKHTRCPRCNTPRVIMGDGPTAHVVPGYNEQLHCSYTGISRFIVPSILCDDKKEQKRLVAEALQKTKNRACEAAESQPCPECGNPLVVTEITNGFIVACPTGTSPLSPKSGPAGTRYVFHPLPGCSACRETHSL